MSEYFDSHCNGLEHAPRELCGAVVYRALHADLPTGYFAAKPLNVRVGPEDSRYPAGADVIDLQIFDSDLMSALREPQEKWFALCRPREDRKNIIHLNLPANAAVAKSVARLAQSFPKTCLIADPFAVGQHDGWQAQVCLAEQENIWLTTRGLQAWPEDSAKDAVYFLVGEVGAGKLLYASDGSSISPDEWLRQFSFLDAMQRELILLQNAHKLFQQ